MSEEQSVIYASNFYDYGNLFEMVIEMPSKCLPRARDREVTIFGQSKNARKRQPVYFITHYSRSSSTVLRKHFINFIRNCAMKINKISSVNPILHSPLRFAIVFIIEFEIVKWTVTTQLSETI